MLLEYVPLLQVQRDLYTIPRGGTRFRAYLRTMIDPHTRDLRLPLVNMNPMGKEHVPRLIDELLSLDADAVARQAVERAADVQGAVAGSFRVALVVVDDAGGGWTNRHTNDYTNRFDTRPLRSRGWLTATVWTADPPSRARVREETATVVHRAAYLLAHGEALSLGEMLAQEGYAMARAGCRQPALDADELEYTRQVLQPLLARRDRPTVMACLYGDRAARSLGYPPQGLGDHAGLALALHRARAAAPAAQGSATTARDTTRAAGAEPP